MIEQADRYYSREDYLRDDHAGMRSQHAPLMKAYMAFFDAGTALDAALEKREDERRAEQLKEIEASEGRSMAYYQIKILGDGKQLTQLLNSETPDLAVARTQLAAFQALLQQAQDDKIGKGDAMWGHVERAADALARDAGRRIERVESKKPYTRSEQMLMESGGRIDQQPAGLGRSLAGQLQRPGRHEQPPGADQRRALSDRAAGCEAARRKHQTLKTGGSFSPQWRQCTASGSWPSSPQCGQPRASRRAACSASRMVLASSAV